MHRRMMLSLAAAVALASSAGAQVPNAEAATEIRKHFLNDLDTLHKKIVALAEAFPADKYTWRPAPGVRSVGEALMHVASEYYVFTPLAYGAVRSPVIARGQEGMQKFEQNASKDSVLKHLREGFAWMKQQVGGLETAKITGTQQLFGRPMTIIETSVIMTADLHEHLGQLIAYARSNGIKPPWSR